jgi:sugar phosphate permease
MADRRRWGILAVGTFGQAATSAFTYGVPMLVPALRSSDGLSLFQSSLVVSAPMAGLLLTLVAWGAVADRHGERLVIASGVGVAAVVLAIATTVHGPVAFALLLALAGGAGGSVNAASGRMVIGWFPLGQRGLAMGTRQTAQPVGVALAALGLPPLAHAHGPHVAMVFPAMLCAVAAVAVFVVAKDPPRPARAPDAPPDRSPYRGSRWLARVHLASSLLVVPQFAITAFTLVYLVGERDWDPSTAGRMIFGFQIAGALGRIASGVWSDRVNSRLRPMRQLAVTSAALMVALSVGAAMHSGLIVLAFALSAVVTVADNGLAYTSVAELAGPEWAGRALGVQNTFQNLTAVAVAPLLGAIIGDSRYALGFAIVAVFPLIAITTIPMRADNVVSVGRLSDPRLEDAVGGGDSQLLELSPPTGGLPGDQTKRGRRHPG